MRNWDEITPLLDAKLDRAHIKPPKQFGPKGDYIEGWHAIAEANRIFGFDGWSYSIFALDVVSERPRDIGRDKKPGFGVTYTARVFVRVGDVTREDVGAGHGYDVDCGLAHESAIKEAVTDALKRALRTFGNPFGLALYDKSGDGIEEPARPAYKKPEPTHASGQLPQSGDAHIVPRRACGRPERLRREPPENQGRHL
jgi:DNA recombination protein Rad52